MKKLNWLQRLSSVFLMMTIALSVAQPGLTDSAFAQTTTNDNVVYDPVTGALAFVGTQPGNPTMSSLANPSTVSPAQNAATFMSTHADQMGLSSISADLALLKTAVEPGGRSTVRYNQIYKGISVFGSEVIVNTDANGAMLSLTAKTSPNLDLDVTPALTADAAIAGAKEAIAKYNNLNVENLTATTPYLQIYDSRLLNPDGVSPRLVWNVTISALDDGISEVVLVDALNGAILLHYNQIDSVRSSLEDTDDSADVAPVSYSRRLDAVLGVPKISIYTLGHTAPDPDSPTGWPGTFICDQGNKTACDGAGGDDADATNAYLNAQDFYNFLKNYLNIDSFDRAGGTINSSIHYSTGYKKVGWVTSIHTAIYGDGYTGSDDMAGHALGFSLLEASGASALILQYQPGAIAESLADMWGEFVDQTNGRGTDTGAVRWIIGENWPGGQQRNMKDPTIAPFHDPDKMTSTNYYLLDDESIGKYKNAGVNNKAVYLMTDGGTFNGKTIAALGIKKVARIYYEAETHLLASASTYFDLYYAVKQACYNLLGVANITPQDCDQVQNALDAVQMNMTNSATVYPTATYCPTGKSRGPIIFSDSMENVTTNWSLSNSVSAPDQWTTVAGEATKGLYHFEGPEPGNSSMAVAELINPVAVPGGYPVYLYFEHKFNFETLGTNYHDGGLIFYSINDGASWANIAPLYASGKNNNGVLASGQGNPLQGQKAFVSFVRGFTSTSFNLTSLAGKSVRFRWIMASDQSVAGSGWFVDNIQVYRCVSIPSVPALSAPVQNALSLIYKPLLRWSNSTPDLSYYMLQVSLSPSFTTLAYQVKTTSASHTLATALAPNKTYYWRTRSYNVANDSNGWSAVRSFRTALAPPVLQTPIGTSNSLLPLYNWSDVAGAKGYTLQVSATSTFTTLVVNSTVTAPTSQYKSTKALIKKKTYFWRVRTTGTNGPSAWVTGSFKTP